ncbi:MAG: DUF885 family protein, partial [Planctomycetota bacterium]
ISELAGRLVQFQADESALQRKYAEPLSEVHFKRFQSFWNDNLADLRSVDFDSLSTSGKVDYALLQEKLTYSLEKQRQEREKDLRAIQLIPGCRELVKLLERHEQDHSLSGKSVAETFAKANAMLAELPESLTYLRDQDPADIEKSVRFDALRAAENVDRLRRRLKSLNTFYDGYDPEFTWWVKQPFKDLDASLFAHGEMLRKNILGVPSSDRETIIGQPIGQDALQLELQHQLIPYTPQELIALAQRQFAWCDREMLRASQEMGFGDDWKTAQEKVKDQYVAPGKQPDLIRELAIEAADFLEARDLITIPPLARESWRMQMMSAQRQRVSPYFLGGEQIIVSFPTDGMTHAEKLMSMRGNNPHFSRATVHHELIPGHHLQQFMTQRYRPDRRLFSTPFWLEGWALYWEMRLWDLDFPRSPEDRVGMLFWRKHRCARIIFSLNYHLGKMTPQECIDFLVDRVGHERRNATAEVRRSVMAGYGPLYQAAYMLGGLQILSLHKDLVESERWTEKQFHDRILREGSIPVTALKAILDDQPPGKNGFPPWRFIEDLDEASPDQ